MRFLLDEACAHAILPELRSLGHEVDHIADRQLRGSPDELVIALCKRESRILITPDLDFSDERVYPPGTHPGIILLRVWHQISPEVMAHEVAQRVSGLDEAKIAGNIVVLEPDSIRIRKAQA